MIAYSFCGQAKLSILQVSADLASLSPLSVDFEHSQSGGICKVFFAQPLGNVSVLNDHMAAFSYNPGEVEEI